MSRNMAWRTQRIKVPSYRLFNTLLFVPTEGSHEFVYLDDVSVRWKPTIAFVKPLNWTLFNESFESAPARGYGTWKRSNSFQGFCDREDDLVRPRRALRPRK